MTKKEVEQELEGKGEYVQIDYLSKFLKEQLTIDLKKFVFLKLASLYEKVMMFSEAGRMYDSAASISIAFTEKINNYLKELECYVKIGAFDRVEFAMKKALGEANSREAEEIYATVKQFYREKAKSLESEMKKNHAARYYEKMLELRISEQERKETREKLMELYKELGKTHEYMLLEKGL